MGLFDLGDRFVHRQDPTVVYECRRCGTAADAGTVVCSVCGAQSIARYEIE